MLLWKRIDPASLPSQDEAGRHEIPDLMIANSKTGEVYREKVTWDAHNQTWIGLASDLDVPESFGADLWCLWPQLPTNTSELP